MCCLQTQYVTTPTIMDVLSKPTNKCDAFSENFEVGLKCTPRILIIQALKGHPSTPHRYCLE